MWAEFAMFIKSKIFRKIFKEASLVKDNIITEEGVYCIHVALPEEDYSFTAYLRLGSLQTMYFDAYYLTYNPYHSPQFSVHFKDDNSLEEDARITIYRLI